MGGRLSFVLEHGKNRIHLLSRTILAPINLSRIVNGRIVAFDHREADPSLRGVTLRRWCLKRVRERRGIFELPQEWSHGRCPNMRSRMLQNVAECHSEKKAASTRHAYLHRH